jgi:exonuclease SbcD
MKLLHFADLHIGVENHGRTDPGTGLSTRLLDFLGAFDELVETAIAEQVDAVIFAGDAYKSRNPEQTHQREFAKRVVALTRADIPVYLLVGNHDLPTMLTRANALEIFSTLAVDKVYVGSRLGTTVMQTRSGPLQVVGVPWPSVSHLLRRDENKNLTMDQIDRLVERGIIEAVSYEAERLDPSLPAVLAAHIAMSDSIVKTSSEKWMTMGRFPQLNRSDLRPDAFDYVALGHHHCYQVLNERPPVVYSGSMQRVDFGEEHDPKGFILIDLDPRRPAGERVQPEDVRFHDVKARCFVTIEATPRGDDPTPEVLEQIARKDVRDAIVRVLLSLTPEQNRLLDERAVRAALAGAHHVAAVSKNVGRAVRTRLGEEILPERLSPEDAVGLYLDSIRTPPDEKRRLLAYARAVIEDDEPNLGDDGDTT